MESYYDFNARSISWDVMDFSPASDIEVVESELSEEEVVAFQMLCKALADGKYRP